VPSFKPSLSADGPEEVHILFKQAFLVYSSADSNEMRRIYFADFLRSNCFSERIELLFAGFPARLLQNLFTEVRTAN
jgi:hypothetical protein